jgi:hypothetical protein
MDVPSAIENYQQYQVTPLCFMFDEIGSDKGVGWHQYSRFYNELFLVAKYEDFNFFELGLGTNDTSIESNMGSGGNPGASLFIWKIFFRRANIYGADIDRKILFQEPRIRTFYCDQTNVQDISDLWHSPELEDKKFGIMIDDGLHTFEAGKIFFENSIHKLLPGGVYIIEDIADSNVGQFRVQMEEWKEKYPSIQFWLVHIESVKQTPGDNWILVAKKLFPQP